MWRQPAILAPLSGFSAPYLARSAISPGISFSASAISLRPHSARLRSAPLASCWVSGFTFDTVLAVIVYLDPLSNNAKPVSSSAVLRHPPRGVLEQAHAADLPPLGQEEAVVEHRRDDEQVAALDLDPDPPLVG